MPGAPDGSYALIGGGAFLAAAMQGPLSSMVLVLELTRHTDALMVPTLFGVAEATFVARRLRAPSIYAARLGRLAEEPVAALIDQDLISDLEGDRPLAPDRG